jgi:hypothetical protein
MRDTAMVRIERSNTSVVSSTSVMGGRRPICTLFSSCRVTVARSHGTPERSVDADDLTVGVDAGVGEHESRADTLFVCAHHVFAAIDLPLARRGPGAKVTFETAGVVVAGFVAQARALGIRANRRFRRLCPGAMRVWPDRSRPRVSRARDSGMRFWF